MAWVNVDVLNTLIREVIVYVSKEHPESGF